MTLISKILNSNHDSMNCSLIPFITAGYPSIDMTIQAIYTLDSEGADVIELGIPYSDALADGPLIQYASKVALNQGIYIDEVLNILKVVTNKINTPIIIFTYYNPVLSRGLERFIIEIFNYGAKGLIIPDLPIEETDYIINLCQLYNIELILFIAPTSSYHRISNIISKSPGGLYLVSSTGVTGLRNSLSNDLSNIYQYIKSQTDKFVMLGFGISNINQASQLAKLNIDAIVIGSAFIKILSDNSLSNSEIIFNLGYFCNNIKSAISIKNIS